MLEEELKNRIATKYFNKFDCDEIIKRIDFSVKNDYGYLLWAEAKQQPTDIYRMLAQLLITIKTDAWTLTPPKFLGCFDSEKIAFVPFYDIQTIFALNDFNWTQTPSQVDDKTVETVKKTINKDKIFVFYFGQDNDNIKNFVLQNFNEYFENNYLSTLIDKNNFIFVYQKWRKMVMPNINVNWDKLKKNYRIYDRDFFLAELNIDDNNTPEIDDDKTAYDNFYMTFDANAPKPYRIVRKDNLGMDAVYDFGFKTGGLDKYADFWKRYKRPPKNIYWDYIVSRLDLLVPQDVRERKGAFFTPQIWVEKSQEYLANFLGANWQEEYYVWDCCTGTGNMLNGLYNKYKIFASTLDQQDIDVVQDRIKNGANLLSSHVFQFDFLNDPFLPVGQSRTIETEFGSFIQEGKLPKALYEIISNPQKRSKLIIYINPPYAEATNSRTITGGGKHREGLSINLTKKRYEKDLGRAVNEIFAQFMARMHREIDGCLIGCFSTLKVLQGPNFLGFRQKFPAKLEKLFVMPADTFDNVNGHFPIGFHIWNTKIKENFEEIEADVFDENGHAVGHKTFFAQKDGKYILQWIRQFYDKTNEHLAYLRFLGTDFQHSKDVFLTLSPYKTDLEQVKGNWVTENNFVEMLMYFTIRHIIPADWLNDRDQFLFPNDGYKNDTTFQLNCLIFALFHNQNRISCLHGVNHFIPFTESEVDAKEEFASHFLSDFLSGKNIVKKIGNGLFSNNEKHEIKFTETTKSVMNCARDLWRYYHTMENANPNASLYDIKEYFQGRNDNGKMNASSDDQVYTRLINELKDRLRLLGEEIKPKMYEYGFLK